MIFPGFGSLAPAPYWRFLFFTTMCNCITEISKKTKKAIQDNNENLDVNYVSIPATQKMKNGKTKFISKSITIIAEFCPFCGEKYDQNGK